MSQKPPYPFTVGGPPPPSSATTHRVIDEMHQGMVLATFEHPAEWRAQSRVIWNMQDTSFPLTCYASVYNPRGSEAVQFLSTEACFWIDPPIIYSPGQRYKGLTCLPPMGALDGLVQYAVPKYRGDRQNLRVAHAQPVPNMARMLRNDWLKSVRSEGAVARLEYEESGRQFEEDFFTCVMWHPPNGEQLNWGFSKLFAFRAERGRLEAARQELWRIAVSWENNPRWDQLYKQIVDQLAGQVMSQFAADAAVRQSQRAWGQQLREYREWESDLHRQTVNHRWESQQRTSDRMGDVLGGYQRFDDPNSGFGVHYDYSQSQYSWTNSLGEWIHTDKPMYNPNSDPNVMSRGPWSLRDPIR